MASWLAGGLAHLEFGYVGCIGWTSRVYVARRGYKVNQDYRVHKVDRIHGLFSIGSMARAQEGGIF